MGKNYLIDTNVIIDFAKNQLPEHSTSFIADLIDNEPKISVINKIELLWFTYTSQPIFTFIEACLVFSLDDNVVDKTVELRKIHKIKLPDAIIAATAIIHQLTLITHNVSDFKRIKNLEVIDSHSFA